MSVFKMEQNNQALLIDGNSLVYRAFFAMPVLTDNNGLPSQGVFGFIKMVYTLIERYNPSHVVVFFDSSSKKRKELFPDYKANRSTKEKKEELKDLFPQLPEAMLASQKMGLLSLRVEGMEADDLMNFVVKQCRKENLKSLLYTNDKDLCQLIDGDNMVNVIRSGFKADVVLDYQGCRDKFKILPEHLKHYLAMLGDSADNIPGLQGFGEKTVVKILENYKTEYNILEHAKTVLSDKMYKKFIDQKEIYELCLNLVDLDYIEPIKVSSMEPARFNGYSLEFKDYLEFKGFKSLLEKF